MEPVSSLWLVIHSEHRCLEHNIMSRWVRGQLYLSALKRKVMDDILENTKYVNDLLCR